MFTTGSKLYFGLGVLLCGAFAIYAGTTSAELTGSLLIVFAFAAVALLGGIASFVRDGARSAEQVGKDAAAPIAATSPWPLAGAAAGGVLVAGLVVDRRVFIAGALLAAATVVEWAVQSLRDRAAAPSGAATPLPLEFPVVGALGIGAIVFGIARALLDQSGDRAVVIFATSTALVLGVIGFALLRPGRGGGAIGTGSGAGTGSD